MHVAASAQFAPRGNSHLTLPRADFGIQNGGVHANDISFVLFCSNRGFTSRSGEGTAGAYGVGIQPARLSQGLGGVHSRRGEGTGTYLLRESPRSTIEIRQVQNPCTTRSTLVVKPSVGLHTRLGITRGRPMFALGHPIVLIVAITFRSRIHFCRPCLPRAIN